MHADNVVYFFEDSTRETHIACILWGTHISLRMMVESSGTIASLLHVIVLREADIHDPEFRKSACIRGYGACSSSC